MKRNKQTKMQKLRSGVYIPIWAYGKFNIVTKHFNRKVDPLCSIDRWIKTGAEQSRNLVFKKKLKPKSWYWVSDCKENWYYLSKCWTRSYE